MHSGNPRIAVRLPPPLNDGTADSAISINSHHVRYTGPDMVLRLTTDASINAVVKRCYGRLSGGEAATPAHPLRAVWVKHETYRAQALPAPKSRLYSG